MKRIFKILLIIVVLIFATLFVIPFAFKGKILKIAQEQANQNLNALVKFDDINLSMFKSFPKLNVELEGLNITGIDAFEGDTLIDVENISMDIDLSSLLSEAIEVKRIFINTPTLGIRILKNGLANYDIVPIDSLAIESSVEDSDTSSGFKLSLQEFSVKNARIVYDDRDFDMSTVLENLNLNMTGDLSASTTDLQVNSSISAFTFSMDGLDYISKAKLELNAGIFADLEHWIFTFKDNALNINDLKLVFEGDVDISDSVFIGMDLKFRSPENSFKSILSLVPAIYAKDFEELTTKGKFTLSGYAKGKMDYDVTVYPKFLADIQVINGFFQYPDLPKSVDNVNIHTKISSVGGPMDNIIVDISQFHVELAQNPLDMSLRITHPDTDMQIAGLINGAIDFSSVKDIIPLDSMDMSGLMKMNLELEGKLSSIENENYEEFTADGELKLSDFKLQMTDVPKINIRDANLLFSPRFVQLSNFDMNIGRSDIHLQGNVENFIPYAFSDEVLKANLVLNSSLLDVNEFLTGEETPEDIQEEPVDSTALEAFQIPENIDFVFNAAVDKIFYDNMKMVNSIGIISVKKGKLGLDNFEVNMLGGKIKTSGYYEATNIENPKIDFTFRMKDISISETYKTFNTVKKLAPIAKYSNGDISVDLRMISSFDKNLNPKYKTLNAEGKLSSEGIGIKNNQLFELIADKFKYEKLRNPKISDFVLFFEIINGNLGIQPFEARFAGHEATIGGNQSIDGAIDYTIDTKLPLGKASELFAKFSGLEKNKESNFKIFIGGTITKPKIRKIESAEINSAKQELTNVVQEKLGENSQKIIEEAKKQSEEILKKAQVQADNLKLTAEKAANKMRLEAENQGKKLVKEAGSNPIKKKLAEEAAKKLKTESDKKANVLISEANAKANIIMEKAQQESNKIIENAEKKANSSH